MRVVAGAPVCPFSELETVMERFDHLESSGVLYFGAGRRVCDQLKAKYPKSVVSLGAQPVWRPETWNDQVRKRKSLRYQFNRARNKGIVVREWTTEEAENSEALQQILNEWLNTRKHPPLHFLVEPETLDYLQDRRTFVAELNDRPVAFLNLCPVTNRHGWLTEQFPRRLESPNGTIELLMHEAANVVAADGAKYLTMGLVPFSRQGSVGENPAWLQRIMEMTRVYGQPLYSFNGLNEFKSKFNPTEWEPVYAGVSGRNFRPFDLITVARAFTGEPFAATVARLVRKTMKL
jgi:phosphatidylglycerol lysyltransferase